MKKWFFRFLLLVVLGIVIWYFFLKDYHYQVSFTTSEPPGTIYQHLLNWDNFDESDQVVELISKSSFSKLEQQVSIGDSSFTYNWCIRPDGATKTRVTAYITDNRNGFAQKIQVPFGSNNFVKRSIQNVKSAGDVLIKKAEAYNVHSIKDTIITPRFCAYISVESRVSEKTAAMLQNIAVVMDYINKNEIELEGDPFLEVTNWDIETGIIKFDFCFPIPKNDALPPSSEVKFKTTAEKKVLKAEYNGNYRYSSNAWYSLLDYADRNNISIDRFPTEYFLNDPHEGGNPLEWKALIFLPLKD